jgi:hypothetical protein
MHTFRLIAPLIVLMLLAGSIADARQSATAPAASRTVPELIIADSRTRQYDSDEKYRRRHDALINAIRSQIDPAGIIVRKLKIVSLDIDTLVASRSTLRAENVLREFRLSPFPDLSLQIVVAQDEQLTEIMTGNLVMTGAAANHSTWQAMMILRQSRTASGQIVVNIQVESAAGTLVIKPVANIVDQVAEEFGNLYVAVYYQLGSP